MSSLRNSIHRREHRERAQPAARVQRFGLLEKHKDYVLRAKDYHRKQDRLTALKIRARNKNEDEFNHGMINAQTKNGIHYIKSERDKAFSGDLLKILKSQDLEYIRLHVQANKKKIDRLRDELGFIGAIASNTNTKNQIDSSDGESDFDVDDDGSQESGSVAAADKPTTLTTKHIVFVDSTDEIKAFSPAVYFQTHPSLVDRTFNRPLLAANEEGDLSQKITLPTIADEETLKENERQRLRRYRELELRLERQRQLEKAMRELEVQKLLMTQKGQRRKVGTDENGNAIFKWRAERRR